MKKLVIIDGNSLLNRAYFALPPMTNKDGLHTNAVHGFIGMILKLIGDKPDYLCITFDVKAKTFRHIQYEDYKGTRKGMAPELAMQLSPLKELLDKMGIKRLEIEGFEADDIIGTLSKDPNLKGINKYIYTGDKDSLQLVDEDTFVVMTKKGISETLTFSRDIVKQEMGVYPEQIIDLKAIMGDNSDNIPGIKGIGAKGAVNLLEEYGTLENLFDNLDKMKTSRTKTLIEEGYHNAFLSKKLATIHTLVPIDYSLDQMSLNNLTLSLSVDLLRNLELKSIIKTIGSMIDLNEAKSITKEDKRTTNIIIEFDYEEALNSVNESKKFIYKLLNYNEHIYLGFFINDNVYITDKPEMFKEIFESKEIKKYGFDLKQDMHILKELEIGFENIFYDLMIGNYTLYPDRNSSEFSLVYSSLMDEELDKFSDIVKKGNRDLVLDYLSKIVNTTYHTYESVIERLKARGVYDLFINIEMPLILVLFSMESEGITLDKEELMNQNIEISNAINTLSREIFELAGMEFNINSTKQLGVILYEKLMLPTIKKTKTGYSTDHETLERLIDSHPIIEKLMEYRSHIKLKNTYIDPLIEKTQINNRINTSFNQTTAVTGRLSSTDPNMQNIPIRLELGRKLRKIFVPKSKEHILVDADYSQIELRILAHMSNDKSMIDSFINDMDIHTQTAAKVFGINPENVTKEQRGFAKGVNFGIVYGISDFGLSNNLDISRKQASKFIEVYFETYPTIKTFLDGLVDQAKKKGYSETLLGRVRDIPDINSSNFNKRSFAQRIAMNSPIQGTAADIMKIAMIKVFDEIKLRNLSSRLVLSVHDELIVDALIDEVEIIKELLVRNMMNAYKLSVPLKVDINVGESWYDTK
jgi:DNA polymerase-1